MPVILISGYSLKEDSGPLFLFFSPLVSGFKQQMAASNEQFRTCVSVREAKRYIGNTGVFAFFHFLVVLLQGISTVCHTKLQHSLAGQFLYMETVDNSLDLGKGRRNNSAHRIGKIKGHFLHFHALFHVYPS